MTTKTLDAAIRLAGGVSNLAVKLGVSQATVSNWKRRGVSYKMRPAVAKLAQTTVENGAW